MNKPIHTYLEVREKIRTDIVRQGVKVGDKLPTITELAVAHEVSRDTMLKAVKGLVDEGVLDSRRRVGLTVRQIPVTQGVHNQSVLIINGGSGSRFASHTCVHTILECLPGWHVFQNYMNASNTEGFSYSFLDGFIEAHPYEVYQLQSVDKRLKEYFQVRNIRCLVVGELDDGIDLPNVAFDEQERFYQAAKYVLECGYESLVFLQYATITPGHHNRRVGVMQALSETTIHDTLHKPQTFSLDDSDKEASCRKIKDVLDAATYPLGIVCGSDIIACWAMQQALEMEKDVPAEVGIITNGITTLPEQVFPQITGVRPDQAKLGFAIAKMINDIRDGYHTENPHIRISFEGESMIIERQTTQNFFGKETVSESVLKV